MKPTPNRRKMADKAAGIRKRLRAGKAISKADRLFLDEWDKTRSSHGPQPDPIDSNAGAPVDPPESPQAASPGVDPGAPAAEAVPSPEPPPRILPSRGERASGGDWRDQYRIQSEGREAACLQVAELWIAGLKRLNRYTIESGRTPVIGDEQIVEWLKPAMVLTCDKILPANFDVSPPVLAACGTTAIMVQAAVAKVRGPVTSDDAPPAGSPTPPNYVRAPEPTPPTPPPANGSRKDDKPLV